MTPDSWYDATHDLLLFRPDGVLSFERVRAYFLAHCTQGYFQTARRYTDLSQCTVQSAGFPDVASVTHLRRQTWKTTRPIVSVIYAPDPVTFGMARMYEQLLGDDLVTIHVTQDLAAAGRWLDLTLEVLQQESPVA